MSYKNIFTAGGLVFLLGILTSTVYASHSWNGYHWGRTANPFSLQLGSNVSSSWSPYLATTATDWSVSTVLDTVVASGNAKSKSCSGNNGRVEVCNWKYGNINWLGLAQVWIDGTHITKGVVKVNDTYFNAPPYNTSAWKNLVMCQEVGHTLGLDHQDEVFDNPNLGTCMDYTSYPETNQHPNQHDYDELAIIYSHLDSTNTVFSSSSNGGGGNGKNEQTVLGGDINLDNQSAWGKALRRDAKGKNSLYVRDIGNGEKIFTFVIWAE